jgi:hypothetical protein
MTAYPPYEAAIEGFRLMRREPRATLVWALLWLAALLSSASVAASGAKVVVSEHRAFRNFSDITHSFGPFAAVFVCLFLLVWATTTVATYRAVLRPHDRRYFFLRLGIDELRVAVMTVVTFVLVLVFGGAPAYLLYVIASPFMRAIPALAREIATLGAILTVCLDIWLGVRLSLLAVETFAERRFHLAAYWPLTRGKFWYLFIAYFIFFLIFFLLSILSFSLGSYLFQTAFDIGLVRVGLSDVLRRASVLGLAGLLAILTVIFWVMSSTLFCACQAKAFRTIVGEGKAGVALT